MTDLPPDDLDAQALEMLEEAAKPKRRVRPRLARKLADAEDLEVQTPNGPVQAWRLGVGPASLLVHGWEDDNALWSPLIDACAATGRATASRRPRSARSRPRARRPSRWRRRWGRSIRWWPIPSGAPPASTPSP